MEAYGFLLAAGLAALAVGAALHRRALALLFVLLGALTAGLLLAEQFTGVISSVADNLGPAGVAGLYFSAALLLALIVQSVSQTHATRTAAAHAVPAAGAATARAVPPTVSSLAAPSAAPAAVVSAGPSSSVPASASATLAPAGLAPTARRLPQPPVALPA